MRGRLEDRGGVEGGIEREKKDRKTKRGVTEGVIEI